MSALTDYLQRLSGKRIAVIGAGVSNTPLIILLRNAGLPVTVHDKKTAEELDERYRELAGLGVSFALGEDYLDYISEDIVFRTPGLHPEHPALKEVRARGGVVTSEMELFFEVCPCPIIGITGSDGKTTTTTLVYEFLKHAGHTCHLGGNIGKPLLPEVEQMTENDIAVVELSSFQLMDMVRSPHISAITNLTPNHLDYHADFEEYVRAKTAIYAHQTENDYLILNVDDEVTSTLKLNDKSKIISCSKKIVPENGVYLKDNCIYIAKNGVSRKLMMADRIRIPGAHNVSNIMMAAAIVQGLCSDEDIVYVAENFGGVEHRIEFVRELDGVKYYNDSIASSPTRTIAGLCAFNQKLILIAGGYDKHIPYDVLGKPICEHVSKLIVTGATAQKIRGCVENTDCEQKPEIINAESLASAVQIARNIAEFGDIVIMSPASASFDCFKNFMERGQTFKNLVMQL